MANWIQQASELPIYFAQVREDPVLDLKVIERLPFGSKILVIGSGGCTVCACATLPSIASISVVDPNPAQIALNQLKLHLLCNETQTQRLQLLGHMHMSYSDRKEMLNVLLPSIGLSVDSFGPLEFVAKMGVDFAGRYEAVFEQICLQLADHKVEFENLLSLSNPDVQRKMFRESPRLNSALATAFNNVLDLRNLVALFGTEATRNRVQSFAEHFLDRTIWAIEQLPARTNPYLWLMLRNRCPEGSTTPWLGMDSIEIPPSTSFYKSTVQQFLNENDEKFDFIHLSNVLDWLDPDEASELLHRTWSRLNHGSYTFIRQLNSNLDIPRLYEQFNWLDSEARTLHLTDRSFFYRQVHLAQRI